MVETMNNQPKWKHLEYSRSKVINAGKVIRKEDATSEEIIEAITIIDNWRAAHAFPLQVIYMHLRRMAAGHDDIIVAERLKRLDSILDKIQREPTMSLWEMQDLGGCRFIVPNLEDLYTYADEYESSRKRHILKKEYDYIKNPTRLGYRSLHRVYQYHSDKKLTYNKNMLIELQFRTHLQHVWATAVETMGLFTNEAIKAGRGSNEIARFFALVSSIFAIQEKQPVVPGTSNDISELVKEIKMIDKEKRYLEFLSSINVVVKAQSERWTSKNAAYYILKLHYDEKTLEIAAFKPSQIDIANEQYNEIEAKRDGGKIDAVLVRVSSFGTLKRAYPNYFSDINEFVNTVRGYL